MNVRSNLPINAINDKLFVEVPEAHLLLMAYSFIITISGLYTQTQTQ